MLNSTLSNLTGELQIHAKGYFDSPDIDHRFILKKQHTEAFESLNITEWTARLQLPGMISSEYETYPVTLVSIEPMTEKSMSFIRDSIIQGHYLTNTQDEIILGQKLAYRLNTQLGKKVVLMTQGKDGKLAEIGLKVVGLFEHADKNLESSMVFTALTATQTWLAIPDEITEISIRVTPTISLKESINDSKTSPLNNALRTLKTEFANLDIQSWRSLQPYADATIKMMDSFNWVWIVFILILMLFGILNTILMSLYERRNEFTTLYTLGLNPWRIRTMLFIEILWILTLASIVSWVLLRLLFWQIGEGIDLSFLSEGAAWFGVSRILYLSIDLPQWLWVNSYMVLSLILVAMKPVWSATKSNLLKPNKMRK